ncbi:hypothetical protein K7X08_032771 [Anisodus acutangulus]|uniref:Uncharacterized protein n=1 Tax=Anisodus acutangulus TaxID=402998 RepID=A0A9Q1M5C8_9SOLA|nr:hypothetical protein K7X08_032771 [Anisodus acutangulus]
MVSQGHDLQLIQHPPPQALIDTAERRFSMASTEERMKCKKWSSPFSNFGFLEHLELSFFWQLMYCYSEDRNCS